MNERPVDTYVDRSGDSHPLPKHWTSNEVWPTDVITQLTASGVESAALVGSANSCSLAPVMPDLKEVRFFDIASGHADIFVSRLNAAVNTQRIVEDAATFDGIPPQSLSSSFIGGAYVGPFSDEQPGIGLVTAIGHAKAEATLFDLDRSDDDRRHFLATYDNLALAADLALKIGAELRVSEVNVDVTNPKNAASANLSSSGERLGWVHISNVAPVCIVREVAKHDESKGVREIVSGLASSMVDFIGALAGVDDETLVTFANYGIHTHRGRNASTVEIGRLGSLDPALLITDADIRECLL